MPAPKNAIKKHGAAAPKGKGQIRAKSGCYTCRIRRKKCDEERHPDNRCGACTRLNIQCLGFGPKRPDWLKEKQPLIIQRIKEHLAGNGKMKNQASAGRSTMEAPYLHLLDEDENDSSSYESPASQSALLPSADIFEPPPPHVTLQNNNLFTLDAGLDIERYHDPAIMNTFEIYDNSSHASTSTLEPLAVSIRPSSYTFNYAAMDDLDVYQPLNYRMLVPGGTTGDFLVAHYINEVSVKQWLLVEKSMLSPAILTAINDPQGFACGAARLLASIHFQRRSRGDIPSLQEVSIRSQYNNLRDTLLQKYGNYSANVRGTLLQKYGNFTADDASGVLLVISSFLFDGGRGEWNMWLSVVCGYAKMLLTRYQSPHQALMMCSPQDRFSIKAAIWFDVLAAITTQKPPNLMSEINHLFHPQASGFGPTPELDMLDPMGCESRVVWALAKTIDLSAWKTRHQTSGTLSIPELVKRSREIEDCLNEQSPSRPLPVMDDETRQKRYYCSEMFRASTTLFLRSVVSGDYPNVPEISEAVGDMLVLLNDMLGLPRPILTAVTRMTVSSLFICGALTNEERERSRLRDLLEGEGAVGNCSTLSRVLNTVWAQGTIPVPWRTILMEENMLLV
ncbi:hypothetical protein BDZ89DRAFT_1005369 [Hymenopellis radicata]|nr:hypothetical protein BDZ89DRAFT_1005369 [Hymenopellis radicata]